uniref:Uncharacterized protein n=1 Tax=Anguilla anguilla TaxID=7936 RepID=A0A0E9SUG1_ANGAN
MTLKGLSSRLKEIIHFNSDLFFPFLESNIFLAGNSSALFISLGEHSQAHTLLCCQCFSRCTS